MERRGSRRVKLENRQLSLSSLTTESPVGCMLEHFSLPLSIKLSTSSIATFSTFCSYCRRLVWALIPVVLPLHSLHRKPSAVVFSTYTQICTFHIQEPNSSYDINTPGCVGSRTSFENLSQLLANHLPLLLIISYLFQSVHVQEWLVTFSETLFSFERSNTTSFNSILLYGLSKWSPRELLSLRSSKGTWQEHALSVPITKPFCLPHDRAFAKRCH